IDGRRVELGSMLSPGAPVARLVDIDTIRVVAGVPERYADDVVGGATAWIEFDRMEGRRFEGVVAFVGATVDEENRTFPIEVVVHNPTAEGSGDGGGGGAASASAPAGRVIKPGMVATLSILRRTIDTALLVPQDAVLRTPDGYIVYTVDAAAEGGVVRTAPVELGPARGGRVLVRSGLDAGARVIVVGQNRVAEGDAVRIVEGVRGE
ncbi:MAG: efflux RND transporter periplasmic adaptor subunit, partial [Gemmatimonadota bacterium]